jgi:hypothetical protein
VGDAKREQASSQIANFGRVRDVVLVLRKGAWMIRRQS